MVGAVTVRCVLLFKFSWEVSLLREYEGDGNAGVKTVGGVVAVNVGCEYMGGTYCSGYVSSADDVLEMSVG